MTDDTLSTPRRQFLKSGVAAAGLAGLGRLNTGAAQAAQGGPSLAGKPNILILMVDEQRYPTPYESQDLQNFRKTYLKTQEALRQTGMEFHRHYAASVACAPSRTCFYTGHYPSLHGVGNTDGTAKSVNDPDMFWLDPNSIPTLGNYFHAAGYRTFYKGKWHLSHADLTVPGTRQSLASYDADGNRDPDAEAQYLAAKRLRDFGFTGWIGPEPHGTNPLNSASSARDKKGRDEAIAGQTIDLLDRLEKDPDTTPWLTVCSMLNPHDITLFGFFSRLASGPQGAWDFSVGDQVPQNLFVRSEFAKTRRDDLSTKPQAQASYRKSYRKVFQPTATTDQYYRLYYQLHQDVDEQLARVYDRLKNSRFFQNTIVLFTSDHGDLLGSHGGLYQKWYTAYEEALHVPLIFSCPALFAAPTGTDILTSHVDILPTLLGLAGLDAESLRQQIEGGFTDARPLVGKDVSAAILGAAAPETLEAPIYFMTDDDPSRGLNQQNMIGLSYASVVQPNHIESVIARLSDGTLWKYSRYYDNPEYWSDPGTPGDSGVQDETTRELGNKNDVGTYVVRFQKTVKDAQATEEFELYDLTHDPLELSNLAGQAAVAEVESQMKTLLAEQCGTKRLAPVSGTVPGQLACG